MTNTQCPGCGCPLAAGGTFCSDSCRDRDDDLAVLTVPATWLDPGDWVRLDSGRWVQVSTAYTTDAGTVRFTFLDWNGYTGRLDRKSRMLQADAEVTIR